ncbi:hypothetical protein ACQ4PT_064550 [Festuca glaucescens]
MVCRCSPLRPTSCSHRPRLHLRSHGGPLAGADAGDGSLTAAVGVRSPGDGVRRSQDPQVAAVAASAPGDCSAPTTTRRGLPGRDPVPPWPGDHAELQPVTKSTRRVDVVLKPPPPPVRVSATIVGLTSRSATPGNVSTDGLIHERATDLGFGSGSGGFDEDIEEFFGQLWVIPSSPSHRRPSPPPSHPPLICWIRKELVDSGEFGVADCFIASNSDCRRQVPKVIWAPSLRCGGQPSFAEILRRPSMSGPVAGRGRGRSQPQRPHPVQPGGNQRPPPMQHGGQGTVVMPQSRPQAPRPAPRNINRLPQGQNNQTQFAQNLQFQQVPQQQHQVQQQIQPMQMQNRFQHNQPQRNISQSYGNQQQFNQRHGNVFGQGQGQLPQQVVNNQQMQGEVCVPQPPPASPIPIEQVMETRYFKMVCFNCGDPGHFVGNCIKPKACFICGASDHPVHQCPDWYSMHPCAAYFGSANSGLGFYHIDPPSEAESKWVNIDNCAIVNIRKGDISVPDLEKNFNAIFCKHKKWPWQIREIDNKNFLVRFPPWKSVSELIDFPAFDLENAGVNVKIVAWDGDCEPLAVLPVAWMLVKGLPLRSVLSRPLLRWHIVLVSLWM